MAIANQATNPDKLEILTSQKKITPLPNNDDKKTTAPKAAVNNKA